MKKLRLFFKNIFPRIYYGKYIVGGKSKVCIWRMWGLHVYNILWI